MAREKTPEEQTTDNERKQLAEEKKNHISKIPYRRCSEAESDNRGTWFKEDAQDCRDAG